MDITTSIPGGAKLLLGALLLLVVFGFLAAWARGGKRDDFE